MTNIVITGARSWENPKPIRAVLRKLATPPRSRPRNLLIVVGGAPGVDTIAYREAQSLGIHVARIDALWDHYGHPAGPIRNGIMLDHLKPSLVLAFHWDLVNESKGTRNCVEQARDRRTPVKLVIVEKKLAMPSGFPQKKPANRKKKAKA